MKKSLYQKLKEKANQSYEKIQNTKPKSVYESLKRKATTDDQDNLDKTYKAIPAVNEIKVNNVFKDEIDKFEEEYNAFIKEQQQKQAAKVEVEKNNEINLEITPESIITEEIKDEGADQESIEEIVEKKKTKKSKKKVVTETSVENVEV